MSKASETHILTVKHGNGGHWYSCSCRASGRLQATEDEAKFDFNTHYLQATTYTQMTFRVSQYDAHKLRLAALKCGAVLVKNAEEAGA